ncbi:MAG: hypothetical protein JNL18_10250 [Planctomycetaceae bacterium]|nr:hypothetical protein [Planctomycetaceae bacterium]
MSQEADQITVQRAFTLGCEIAAHVLGRQPGYYLRSIDFLNALAGGEATLLESPTDTAAWLQQMERDRVRIVETLGEQGFRNVRRHYIDELNLSFAQRREEEIALAQAVQRSLGVK